MGDNLPRRREDEQAEGELDLEQQRIVFGQESQKNRGELKDEREQHSEKKRVEEQIKRERSQLRNERGSKRNRDRDALAERLRVQESYGNFEEVYVEPIVEENEELIPEQNDEVGLGRGITITDEVIREAQNLKEADESDPSSIRYSRLCLNCMCENPIERAACIDCGKCICKPCADKRDCPACQSTIGLVKIFENGVDEGNADKSPSIRYCRRCPICVIGNPRQRVFYRACGHIICFSCAVQIARTGGNGPCCMNELRTGFVKLIEEEYESKKENDFISEISG